MINGSIKWAANYWLIIREKIMKDLVLIHGRSQEGKNAIELKASWVDAWARGLGKDSLDVPITDSRIHFPYYGDSLFDLTNGSSVDDAARIIVRGAEIDITSASFINRMLEDYVNGLGITDAEIAEELPVDQRRVIQRGIQNLPWVQAALRVMDQRLPGTGAAIALATYDVYIYLTNDRARTYINDGVRKAIRDCSVVVAHSLGTIVAYNVLRDLDPKEVKIPLLVTLGSPLGIRSIREKLSPIKHPPCVFEWRNARDPRDVVALYPLDNVNFDIKPSIINKSDVFNHTSNCHGIAGYFDDPVVAQWVYDAISD